MAAGAAVAVTAAVVWGIAGPSGAQAMPGPQELAGLTAERAVATVNRWRQEGHPIRTWVTDRAVEAQWPDGRTARVELPADRMYLAVAPYVRQTHPCAVHVPSSCQGELPDRWFEVTVQERQAGGAAGEVVFSGRMRSLPNGFVELWLPRGREFMVTVRQEKMAGQAVVSTKEGAPTCITTVRLTRV